MKVAFGYTNTVNNINPPKQRVCPTFTAQQPDKFVRTGLKVFINTGRSDSIFAENPMPVCEFLDEISTLKRFKDNQDDIKIFIDSLKDTPLKDIKIKQLMGYGSSALALEMKNGKILKLSRKNHFPMNRPVEDFDAEVFTRGKIGKTYYYVAEKCTPCQCGQGYAPIMIETIREYGYRPYDIGIYDDFQVGFNSKCELKLLDPECAQYKTPIHKIVDVVRDFFEK